MRPAKRVRLEFYGDEQQNPHIWHLLFPQNNSYIKEKMYYVFLMELDFSVEENHINMLYKNDFFFQKILRQEWTQAVEIEFFI